MLFQNTLQTIDQNIDHVNQEIQELEQKLETLREYKTQQEAHKQALLTAEQASESAIAQLTNAIAMVNTVSPDDLHTLKEHLDALFEKQPKELLTGTEPDIEVISQEDDDDIPPSEVIITIPPIEETQESDPQGSLETYTPHTHESLQAKTQDVLRMIATEYGISKRLRKKSTLISKILEAQESSRELVA